MKLNRNVVADEGDIFMMHRHWDASCRIHPEGNADADNAFAPVILIAEASDPLSLRLY
jgi:hypothetical protein